MVVCPSVVLWKVCGGVLCTCHTVLHYTFPDLVGDRRRTAAAYIAFKLNSAASVAFHSLFVFHFAASVLSSSSTFVVVASPSLTFPVPYTSFFQMGTKALI